MRRTRVVRRRVFRNAQNKSVQKRQANAIPSTMNRIVLMLIDDFVDIAKAIETVLLPDCGANVDKIVGGWVMLELSVVPKEIPVPVACVNVTKSVSDVTIDMMVVEID